MYIILIILQYQTLYFQDVCKWSAQNFGKHPDPWYKLKFRPKEVKVKIKKEKPVKELTEKQKKKLEKVRNLHLNKSYIRKYLNLKEYWFLNLT